MKNNFWLLDKKILRIVLSGVLLLVWMRGGLVRAEPQFGGKVVELIVCTCTHNEFLKVSDPHGGDNGTEGKYIINASTTKEDCEPLQQGEYILGMHTENSEVCQIRVHGACVRYDSGLVIDHYGSSPSNCETGLEGDASGDGKAEMMTPDGRTADGGDEDDGGPSGGPSKARRHDRHLKTVDGVKADGTVEGGTETEHMETPDHQNYEGSSTTKMETAPTGRKEDGTNSSVFTSSGSDDGYSPAGAGIGGEGYGSVGGSVGSGGLQSPVVLGERDRAEDAPGSNGNDNESNDVNYGDTNKDSFGSGQMLMALTGLGLGGYFVGRAGKKMLKR